jgi:hypothetical protein
LEIVSAQESNSEATFRIYSHMIITVIKNTIQSGSKHYPVFIGFMKAADVLKVSDVPNFLKDEKESVIAKNLQLTPVKDWQRPLIQEKRESITKFFNDTGEFMPNPVLLSENPEVREQEAIVIKPKIIAGETTEFWEIHIGDHLKALWIIDGQHRIKGLGHDDCKQNTNPIPVVFMLNPKGTELRYSPTDFAKIFAQVTTSSTPLFDLHKEWLEFAFRMGKYEKPQWVDSMKTVVELCSRPNFQEDNGQVYPNPFLNQIIFNDEHRADNVKMNCQVLAELVYDYYYSISATHVHYSPVELANQISMAFHALGSVIKDRSNSVFLSDDSDYRHMVMVKSLIKGLFRYILVHQDPRLLKQSIAEWVGVYRTLNFHQTDWDWSSHTNPSDKSWYKDSERLASVVLIEAFKSLKIPDNCVDLQDCIVFGNNLEIIIQCVVGSNEFDEAVHGSRTINRIGTELIRIVKKSFSAEILSILDKRTTANFPERYNKMDMDRDRPRSGKGVEVPQLRLANKKRPRDYDSGKVFTLEIRRTLYGGKRESLDVLFRI